MRELTQLIEQTITAPRNLSDTFSQDVNAGREQPSTTIRRAEKELLLSIGILLPKLEAARQLFDPSQIKQSRRDGCDD